MAGLAMVVAKEPPGPGEEGLRLGCGRRGGEKSGENGFGGGKPFKLGLLPEVGLVPVAALGREREGAKSQGE